MIRMKFKNKIFLFVAIASMNSGFIHAQKQKDRVREMMENLSKDELIKHLSIIASDEMEGRKTG